MMTTNMMLVAANNDAELVSGTLAGNRDAFGQIVSRYQSLICSLAYSATGSLGQSEDLAQETFITAWKHLGHLRERHKLRAWLCGIARNRINNFLRREGREPIREAESLENVPESHSPGPLPAEQTISNEEQAILWRSLERIPEIYREPLVLFYREHQSIEAVAQNLELTEDTVKQRLSRGRKLLHEQVLAFVEGALERTNPGKTFTLGVLAALPLLATTAKAAAVGATATKGGSAAKAATGAGALSAFLTGGAMFLFSLFGVFGFFGRWLGRKMGRTSQQSPLGRKRIIQFWRTLAIGFFVFVLPPMLVPNSMIHAHPWFFRAMTWLLTAFYCLVAAAWLIWIWQRRRDFRRHEDEKLETNHTTAKSYNTWVILGMIGPAWIVGIFVFAVFFSDGTWSWNSIPEEAAQKIIFEHTDARFTVYQYRDGSKSLEIRLPEDRRIAKSTPWNDSLFAALTEKGITYQTLIEDQDFHNGGVSGWLPLLSTFIAVTGVVLLLRRPGTQNFYQQEITTPRAERREKRVLAVGAALAMIAMSLLIFGFTISHYSQSISAAAAGKMITENKDARFEVFQFDNGSKELWITPPRSRHYPGFIAPADEPTLATLADNKLSYKTHVQGRDFGFRQPSRWILVPCLFILPAGAVFLLRRAWKKERKFPTPAEANV
jgi:RNA polymerase sigma factor (sigma-70 family)